MQQYKVTLTFVEPVLGTVPKDREVYASYVAGKTALTDEALAQELETVEQTENSGWTGFHTLPDGTPCLYDYVLKGFFKDACGMLRRVEHSQSGKIKAFKKIIDGLVFVSPRRIPLQLNGGVMGMLERPLRAQTAQGERVALVRSDMVPAGTVMEFAITILGEVSRDLLEEWLGYGALRGLGQWRNASYGRFTYKIED